MRWPFLTERPPRTTIEAHTKHLAGSRGSDCVECHMPKIEPTIANINVRSHTFKFITPASSTAYKIPNPCIVCHTSQTNEWADQHLKTWDTVSPSRTHKLNLELDTALAVFSRLPAGNWAV